MEKHDSIIANGQYTITIQALLLIKPDFLCFF